MQTKEYLKAYYQANKDRIKEVQRAYRIANAEKVRAAVNAWHKANAESQKAYRRDYYVKNGAVIRARSLEQHAARKECPEFKRARSERDAKWRRLNPHKNSAKSSKRRASLLKRTPKWLTSDDFWLIEEIYELAALRTKITGIDWHVDHVIPLQGRTVCGLHVPTNLQVIPAKDNLKKHNRFA
jgi:hypothetical protein